MLRSSRPMLLGLIAAVCLSLAAPVAYADQDPASSGTTSAATSVGTSTGTAPATPGGAPTTLGQSGSGVGQGLGSTVDPLLAKAKHALARVQHIFTAPKNGPLAHAAINGSDPTIALRNLALTYHALPRAQRRTAKHILARPDGSGLNGCDNDYACYGPRARVHRICEGTMCVHWVSKADDATNGVPVEDNGPGGTWDVPAKDAGNGIPDMVDYTLEQMQYISQTYVNAGYRTPLPDGTTGGNKDTDIYLANVGNAGVYGYCTPDDPRLNRDLNGRKHWPLSAYCVLDNDFSEFPRHTPPQNLDVTAAHEFFHAVQFAYDADEDAWMMEATAVWAEDELYNSINDNRGYLRSGPMHQPQTPLDRYAGLNEYGAWAFFRFLTERYPTAQGGLPTLIRLIWEHAASYGPHARGMYSLQAIQSVLQHRHHTTLAHQFTRFALANRFPAAYYSEGAHYPRARLTLNARLTPSNPRRETTMTLKHLSARHLRFRPGPGLRPASRLRIRVDGAAKAVGGTAVVRIKPVAGAMRQVRFRLDRAGDGAHSVPFGRGRIAWVEVSVLNTSSAYHCLAYTGSDYWAHTCQGKPRRDANHTTVVARALR